jgi:hypothetical protein
LEEPNILVVDEDVYETADLPLLVEDALAEAWVCFVEFIQNATEGGAGRRYFFLIVGELPEGSGNADCCHSSDWV